ncbi:hypothetical protein [Pseudovibrio sp. POLY-S9]|uniref:hypothetical protein n=1 Tax=Pseudovibrio sp. POLY-S9 TaxID=1576596 RepID=UPI000B223ABA|nr:hypothetical protein [Pseudovibrio sp. POLY-S9]
MRSSLLFIGYQLAALGTLVYLMFLDGYQYNWWNWIVAVPINFFLAEIWPIYWALLHWIS